MIIDSLLKLSFGSNNSNNSSMPKFIDTSNSNATNYSQNSITVGTQRVPDLSTDTKSLYLKPR